MAAKEFLAQNNVYLDHGGNISFDKQIIEKSIKDVTVADFEVYSRLQALSSAALKVKPSFTDKRNRQKTFDEKAFATAGREKSNNFGLLKFVHQFNNDEPEYWQFIKNQFDEYVIPFNLLKPDFDISNLLPSSFFIQFKFKLAKPFISRDDEPFYIIENPVKKDKVFKVPMMSPSGWKGNLRWTAGRNFIDTLTNIIDDIFAERLRLIRIFGHETEAVYEYFNECIFQRLFNRKPRTKKEKKDFENEIVKPWQQYLEKEIPPIKDVAGLQGRLHFYPTFFDKIDLEVINPHDRKTRAGKNPIYFEVVPDTATGNFSLLWFPFDLAENNTARKEALKEDWNVLKEALKNMFFTYGFSAKKTSGFGVIENSIYDKRFIIAGTSVDLQEMGTCFFDDFLQTIDARIMEVADE